MKLKFCGIKCHNDVELMNKYFPNYAGFVFADSKRQVKISVAASLISELSTDIVPVGVFVNARIPRVLQTIDETGIKIVQLHGMENMEYIRKLRIEAKTVEIWKAVNIKTTEDIENAQYFDADMLLFDSYVENQNGGTGTRINLDIIENAKISAPFFLAGGINKSNLEEIILKINPYGIDISSGIEENGYKNDNKINEIMRCLNG